MKIKEYEFKISVTDKPKVSENYLTINEIKERLVNRDLGIAGLKITDIKLIKN